MFTLPDVLISEIFEFDNTYKEKYDEVLCELKQHIKHCIDGQYIHTEGKWFFVSGCIFIFASNWVWEFWIPNEHPMFIVSGLPLSIEEKFKMELRHRLIPF